MRQLFVCTTRCVTPPFPSARSVGCMKWFAALEGIGGVVGDFQSIRDVEASSQYIILIFINGVVLHLHGAKWRSFQL